MVSRLIRRAAQHRPLRCLLALAWGLGQAVGCHAPSQIHYLGQADLKHYEQAATKISYPTVQETGSDPSITLGDRPPTVRDPAQQPPWDLTLAEALQLALQHSQIIRARGTFRSPNNPLLTSPDRLPSRLDPAIQETGSSLLSRGPEAALAAFDTQFKTSMMWGRDENAQNNFFLGGGLGFGQVLQQDTAQFRSSLSKTMVSGGTWELSHNWDYLYNNSPFQLFPSVYRGYARADYRQPLLAGAGVEYTRIAGPISRSLPGFAQLDGGVVIARINTDMSIADFELAVVNLVRDVEDLYWELYLAYRTYDAELAAREATLSFWRNTKKRMEIGARNGAPLDEAQARENYFATRIRVENAIGTLYSTEGQLRRLLGLPVNDGRILRPADEPTEAEYLPDWRMAVSESLVRRAELRRQKWQIKSLELQLTAADNLIKPRLDFVSGYQLNGFGDQLISQQSADGFTQEGFNSAVTALRRGNQTSWDLGFEFSLPIGLRQALAQKRNVELRLTKARAILAAQELEVTHELSSAVQLIDWWYQILQTSFHRRLAAEKEVEAAEKEQTTGRASLDLVLRARANLAAAEVGYFNALVKYNQALTDLRVRKGTLLEENQIHLAEGGWTQEAYDEALRRAWARSFAKDNDRLDTVPAPVSLPDGSGMFAFPPDHSGPGSATGQPFLNDQAPAPQGNGSPLQPVPADLPPPAEPQRLPDPPPNLLDTPAPTTSNAGSAAARIKLYEAPAPHPE